MLIITAPGQGAQTPGFLSPWLELPGVEERLGTWSELAGCDLVRAGTTADADEIRDTAVAQPLLVAAALIAAAVLDDGDPAKLPADVVAGHSVGELSAGVIAGVLTAADAMRLTGVRGKAMAAAAAIEPTGMTAVLGGNEQEVLAAIAAHGLTPANINGAGQIVAAGMTAQLAAFAASPPAGARLRPLQVAGAFHTSHMEPAVTVLRAAAREIEVQDPVITLLSDTDGSAVTTGKEWLERVVGQVAAPVRWDLCLNTMRELASSQGHSTGIIELPPAGTLTGLAKRVLGPDVELLAVKGPDQIQQAREFIEAHLTTAPAPHGQEPEWRIVVAGATGTFRPNGMSAGTAVSAGTELGQIQVRGGTRPVTAATAGEIVEWLAEDGDPVSEGQPLVRVQPA